MEIEVLKYSEFIKIHFTLIRLDWNNKGFNKIHWTNPSYDEFKIDFYRFYLSEMDAMNDEIREKINSVFYKINPEYTDFEMDFNINNYMDNLL